MRLLKKTKQIRSSIKMKKKVCSIIAVCFGLIIVGAWSCLKIDFNNPKYATIYIYRAYVYGRIFTNFKEAIKNCSKAIELNPSHPKIYNAYYLRGLTYCMVKDYQKARDDLTVAIQLYPKKYAEAYSFRAVALYKIDKAAAKDSCNDLYQAGLLFLERNEKKKVQECINAMKTIDPSSSLIQKLQKKVSQNLCQQAE